VFSFVKCHLLTFSLTTHLCPRSLENVWKLPVLVMLKNCYPRYRSFTSEKKKAMWLIIHDSETNLRFNCMLLGWEFFCKNCSLPGRPLQILAHVYIEGETMIWLCSKRSRPQKRRLSRCANIVVFIHLFTFFLILFFFFMILFELKKTRINPHFIVYVKC
jgi:hypothetical protein